MAKIAKKIIFFFLFFLNRKNFTYICRLNYKKIWILIEIVQ